MTSYVNKPLKDQDILMLLYHVCLTFHSNKLVNTFSHIAEEL